MITLPELGLTVTGNVALILDQVFVIQYLLLAKNSIQYFVQIFCLLIHIFSICFDNFTGNFLIVISLGYCTYIHSVIADRMFFGRYLITSGTTLQCLNSGTHLCRDNQHLRHELSLLKERHIRQQRVLNKVSNDSRGYIAGHYLEYWSMWLYMEWFPSSSVTMETHHKFGVTMSMSRSGTSFQCRSENPSRT